MKETRAAEQVYRTDGQSVFLEVTTYGLAIDKVHINFVEYDEKAPKGQRQKSSIGIYMNTFEAQLLSRDIMSGRIPQMGNLAREDAKAKGQKYAVPVVKKLSGTPSKYNNGQAIARIFEITPGEKVPWILCAKQGKAYETDKKLIVMDGKPETTIRVPLANEKLKEFALAIEDLVQLWFHLRFAPVIAPAMQIAAEKRNAAINEKKEASAQAQTGRR